MFRIIGKIPKKVTIAFSGGIDSVSVTNFLLNGKREINLAFFNHDTVNSRNAENFVKHYADSNNLKLTIGRTLNKKEKRQSFEEYWRNERYNFLNSLKSEYIITCHHLDDNVETWLMSSIHGLGKLIPYKREPNIYRPFLMTSKMYIKEYASRSNLSWYEDTSNLNTDRFARNHVRHNLMPLVLKINPGIRTTIRKKLLAKYKNIL